MAGEWSCACCQRSFPPRGDNDPWDGRLVDYCYDCALARCDAFPGECPVQTVNPSAAYATLVSTDPPERDDA